MRQLAEDLLQVGETRARLPAHRDEGRRLQEGARDELARLQAHQVEDVRLDEIALGQDDDAARDAQQSTDVEMLASLRLDRFVRRDA